MTHSISEFFDILVFYFKLSGSSPTTCQKEHFVALSNYKVGRYVPSCTPKGDFSELQLGISYSFCVDNDGREVLGTRTPKPFHPRCKGKGEYIIDILLKITSA